MHVVQLMLVTAEADEQFESVQAGVDATLEDLIGQEWFDWFGEGAFGKGLAGRWSGEYGADVLRYSDDPEKAEALIETFSQIRMNHLQQAQREIQDFDIRVQLPNNEFDLVAWRALSVARVLAGDWTPDSGFYDLETHSTSLRYFRDRVAENPSQQYLVIVDFHF